MSVACPVCSTGTSVFHARIDGYDYFRCTSCGSLHIDVATLDAIDHGEGTRVYDETYWRDELRDAKQRAGGESQVRAGEAILYARRRVCRFLDVGTGPGYLLDALAQKFPNHPDLFHGVESFPPDEHSKHPNYLIGDVAHLDGAFDAGVCIEVIEHLTPRMLEHLVAGLARVSRTDSLWLFNTSLAERTLNEDPSYLDPLRRGHIVSYSLRGVEMMFAAHGFVLTGIPGKNYAFIAEFKPTSRIEDFEKRITEPLPANKALLDECGLLSQAAVESGRASFFFAQYLERTKWALDTNAELDQLRQQFAAVSRDHERTLAQAQFNDAGLQGRRRPSIHAGQHRNRGNGGVSRIARPAESLPGTDASTVEAIILVGGLGTRLRSVIGDLPKPLAPVAGRPFLAWLLDMLARQGIRRTVLATGYGAAQIESTVGRQWRGMELVYSHEPEPLGTGGAIVRAARLLDGEACFVLNGDTCVRLDYANFADYGRSRNARLGMALAQVVDVARYGAVRIGNGCVRRFVEKGKSGSGYVNAGVYWMDRSLVAGFPATPGFSFERDVLVPLVGRERVAAFTEVSDFIDIGVPEDYARAQEIFAAADGAA